VKETGALAISGNSLILDPKNATVPAQYEAAYETALHIVPLLKEGHNLAVVHGNGPQVGFILRRGRDGDAYRPLTGVAGGCERLLPQSSRSTSKISPVIASA
jgi:carbamate kinase